jgi:DNA-binding NtrC family response regulator
MTPLDAVLDRPSPAEAASRAPQTAPLRILVADDQRDVIEALRLLLGASDMIVVGAQTPAEALSLAGAQPFDAALVDLNYGKGRTSGEQGLDLVAAMRKQHPAMPVVVMTAWGSAELARTALRRGARDFVEKPWDEFRMVTAVRTQAELGRATRTIAELHTELRRLRGQTGTPAANGAADHGAATAPTSVDGMRLLEVEGMLVRQAMTRHDGNVSRAARALGLSRSALYRRLERHKI